METIVRKRKLFDESKLQEELALAIQANDIVQRVKIDNRIQLNNSVETGCGLDGETLSVVMRELKKFNKDRRSYGINTGIEIAMDIVAELQFRIRGEK